MLPNGYKIRQKKGNAPKEHQQCSMDTQKRQSSILAAERLIQKQANSLCHLGDNLQTAITVAKNSEMIPRGSQVILVEANEPEDFVPASVTWQLVENQENGLGKNVSKC